MNSMHKENDNQKVKPLTSAQLHERMAEIMRTRAVQDIQRQRQAFSKLPK